MNYKFRDLQAEEIECRIALVKNNGLSLLLYKDARCDMKILDETVGAENWQRDHKECKGNLFCGVSIINEDNEQWITKWDCGTESYSDKKKGEASDSFKRACFNWGIGRELYTSPFIWIKSSLCTITQDKKTEKFSSKDKFRVSYIEIKDKIITKLKILNETTGVVCFEWDINQNKNVDFITDGKILDREAKLIYKALLNRLKNEDEVVKYLFEKYEIENTSQLSKSQYVEIVNDMKEGNKHE